MAFQIVSNQNFPVFIAFLACLAFLGGLTVSVTTTAL
jgi:hypothetical protein